MGNKISFRPRTATYEDNLKKEIAEKNQEISKLNQELYSPIIYKDGVPITAPSDEEINNNPNIVNNVNTNVGGARTIARAMNSAARRHSQTANDFQSLYNDELAENETLRRSPQGDYAVLFTTVKKENEQIDKQIKELSDSYSTDNQKANYQSEKILTLKRINYVLFILYYIALLILTLVLFMYNTTMTKQKKVVIIVLLMIFPFISDILYQLLEYIYKFIYATLNGNAYTANNYSGK